MQQLDNTTPNQEGENQTSPSILNYYLNPLPGLENSVIRTSEFGYEYTDSYINNLVEKYKDTTFIFTFNDNFESEPE